MRRGATSSYACKAAGCPRPTRRSRRRSRRTDTPAPSPRPKASRRNRPRAHSRPWPLALGQTHQLGDGALEHRADPPFVTARVDATNRKSGRTTATAFVQVSSCDRATIGRGWARTAPGAPIAAPRRRHVRCFEGTGLVVVLTPPRRWRARQGCGTAAPQAPIASIWTRMKSRRRPRVPVSVPIVAIIKVHLRVDRPHHMAPAGRVVASSAARTYRPASPPTPWQCPRGVSSNRRRCRPHGRSRRPPRYRRAGVGARRARNPTRNTLGSSEKLPGRRNQRRRGGN